MSLERKINKVFITYTGIALVICITIGLALYGGFFNKSTDGDIEPAKKETEKIESKSENKKPDKPVADKIKSPVEVFEETEQVITPENEAEETEETIETENETALEKELAKIDIVKTKSLFHHSEISLDSLPNENVYYHGENGKLESKVKHSDKGISEQLTAYDIHGNNTGTLEIGFIEETGKRVKYAVISKNKISVFEITLSKNKKSQGELMTEYTITPQMKLIKGKTYHKL
jgi:hypothetical protein